MEIPNCWRAVTIGIYSNSSPAQTKKRKSICKLTNTHIHTHAFTHSHIFVIDYSKLFKNAISQNNFTLKLANGTFIVNRYMKSTHNNWIRLSKSGFQESVFIQSTPGDSTVTLRSTGHQYPHYLGFIYLYYICI